MLHFTLAQVDRFALVTRADFVARMSAYLCESFPERVAALDDAHLSGWVDRALVWSEKVGIDTELEAAQTILLLLVLGLDAAEREPWIREASAYDGAPIGKLRRLIGACRARHIPIADVLVHDGPFPEETKA